MPVGSSIRLCLAFGLVGGMTLLAAACDQTCTTPAFPQGLPANDGYHDMQICQIQVHMESRLYNATTTAQEVHRAIAADLAEIRQRIPEPQARFLRNTHIWVDLDRTGSGAAVTYHPSAQWLMNNGYPVQMEKDIHIERANAYVAQSQPTDQPAILLHEFAHALFDQRDQALRDNVQAAYDNAMRLDLYDDVLHRDGTRRDAYATTNVQEYFAELTEAYFWENDAFPFTQEELEMHDPMGYAAIEAAWGITP